MYERELKELKRFRDLFVEYVLLGGCPVRDDEFWLGLDKPPENPQRIQELRSEINLSIAPTVNPSDS